MKILVFGNENVESDAMPLRILPELQKAFPEIDFEIKDPNEEFDSDENPLILDTAEGIKKCALFTDLESFAPFRRSVTVHDFDLYADLALLKKTGRLKKLAIIAVPPDISEEKAFAEVSDLLFQLKKKYLL